MQKLELDMSECIMCGICSSVCPDVFRENKLGFMEIYDFQESHVEDIREAVKNCPQDCIIFED